MDLHFRRFQAEHYSAYAAWFADPELNSRLGPMDDDWLNYWLSAPEAEGVAWAVFDETELVAVVETAFDPKGELPAAITAIATRPSRRGQGIGTAVLQWVLALHKSNGIAEHIAYIWTGNAAGRRLAEKSGFTAVTSEPNEHGYIQFRHGHSGKDPFPPLKNV
jgi:GNAT superfamily N-acetyltransferase